MIMELLEVERKQRALEILNLLVIKGFKKIGKDKIKDLENDQSRVDYDTVIEFYQGVIRKEREAVEEDKKKKLRDVELWNRAQREEEKIAIQNYAKQHGEEEIKQIQQSILEKQSKELKDKQSLESAKPYFDQYMQTMMGIRNTEWENKKQQFKLKKM